MNTSSEFPSEVVCPAEVVKTEERRPVKSKPSKFWTFGGLVVGVLLFQIVRPQIWVNETPFPNWAEMLAGFWAAFSAGFGAFVGRLAEGKIRTPRELAPLLPPQPPQTNTTASPAVVPATGFVADSELDPKLKRVSATPGAVQSATSDDFPSEVSGPASTTALRKGILAGAFDSTS